MTREEAIDKLQDLWNEVYNEDSDGYDYAEAIDMAIEALSAEAVQGEWGHMIADGTDGSHWYEYECSHCGEVVLRPYNFCPNCGAKMTKGGDDTTGESL